MKNILGNKILIYYTLIFIFIPFVCYINFESDYKIIYKTISSYTPVVYIIFQLILTLIISNLFINKVYKGHYSSFSIKIFEGKAIFYLAILFLIISIFFLINYNLNFRHNKEVSITSEGPILMLLFALKAFFRSFLLLLILKFIRKDVILKQHRKLSLLLFFSYLFSIAAALDVIFIFLSLIFAIKKERNFFLIEKGTIIKRINNYFFVVILLITVFFIGNANKVGIDKAQTKFSDFTKFEKIMVESVRRISTWYMSVMILGEKDFEELAEFSNKTNLGILNNTKSRFNQLMGLSTKKENFEYWSANRSNYLIIDKNGYNDYTGSSPGFYANCYYLPFFPLGLLIIPLFIGFFIGKLNFITKKTYNVSFLLIICLIYTFFSISFSTIDYINIFSPEFFNFLGIILVLEYFIKIKKKSKSFDKYNYTRF